jgi:hypothetical protein
VNYAIQKAAYAIRFGLLITIFVEVNTNHVAMGISLNFIACALFSVWAIEYFGYNAGKDIHILLLIGILLVVARLILLFPFRREPGSAEG